MQSWLWLWVHSGPLQQLWVPPASGESLIVCCSQMATKHFQHWPGKSVCGTIINECSQYIKLLPVPPPQKQFNLIFLLWVIKEFENAVVKVFEDTVVKAFWVCWKVWMWKDLGRCKGKMSVWKGWATKGKDPIKTETYLCHNISNQGFSYQVHSMDASIARAHGLWLFNVDGTQRSEYKLVCLHRYIWFVSNPTTDLKYKKKRRLTDTNSPLCNRPFQGSSGSYVCKVHIQKYRPLVSCDLKLSGVQLLLDSATHCVENGLFKFSYIEVHTQY